MFAVWVEGRGCSSGYISNVSWTTRHRQVNKQRKQGVALQVRMRTYGHSCVGCSSCIFETCGHRYMSLFSIFSGALLGSIYFVYFRLNLFSFDLVVSW